MIIIWLAAVSLMLLISDLTHKGKVFNGSTGDGLTMWAILITVFVVGFLVGTKYEAEKQDGYAQEHIDIEPAVTGSKWNEY